MWDKWDLAHPQHRPTFERHDLYTFCDVSQNNHQKGQAHYDNAQKQRRRIAKHVRPLNNVKIYGSDEVYLKSPPGARDGVGGRFGRTRDATERFWRNTFGGMASSRFHRPPSDLGLGKTAQACIRSMRMLAAEMDVFACEPHNDLLSRRKPNEAYCLANPGKEYAVYFPNGGQVGLDLSHAAGKLTAKWLDIARSRWAREETLDGGTTVTLTPPARGHWAVLIRRSPCELRLPACPRSWLQCGRLDNARMEGQVEMQHRIAILTQG